MLPLSSHKLLTTALALLLGVGLAACDTASPEAAIADGAAAKASRYASGQAVYEARLTPLNPSVNGRGVTGKATFIVDGDQFTAMVDARGLATDSPLGIHPQHIHAGSECPTMADDANGDKILDVLEGLPKYGPILVSLDQDLADLSFQTSFPSAMSIRGRDDYGVIDYKAMASLSAIESALGERLALETRHVVLHAVSADTELPASVATLGDLPAQLTLPVACGEIRRVR